MPKSQIMATCDLCGTEFHFGANEYNGRRVPRYGMMVCATCYNASRDGWAPDHEVKILVRLKRDGLEPPPRNASGLLPRD